MSTNQKSIQALSDLEPLKTWSLIFTLLGDMNQPCLSGKEMGETLGYVGVKPEAIRVAIHRLKKDGWINTDKNGREVNYRLSAFGKATTKSVYDDVYRSDLKYDGNWRLLLVEADDALEDKGSQAIRLLKRVYLLPASCSVDPNVALDIELSDRQVPSWLVERLVPDDVLVIAKKLSAITNKIVIQKKTNNKKLMMGSMDGAVLRLLVLHRWRKMALYENVWAHIGLFPDGDLAQCHRNVTQLLAKLPRIDSEHFSSDS